MSSHWIQRSLVCPSDTATRKSIGQTTGGRSPRGGRPPSLLLFGLKFQVGREREIRRKSSWVFMSHSRILHVSSVWSLRVREAFRGRPARACPAWAREYVL